MSQLIFSSITFKSFLAGLRQKLSVLSLPKRPINLFKLDRQSRQQALRAYCHNIYTVHEGNTGLHLSCYYGHLDCVKILVNKSDIDIFAKNKRGGDALYEAKSKGQYNVIFFLKQRIRSQKQHQNQLAFISCKQKNSPDKVIFKEFDCNIET